ncbi:NACHT domain-containing protein [Nocardia sp. SC052]|uniref:NACHT domain-containing protein n=1 Tax=Nocardia sichangensis TaxID=3385975 RepID=UPI0039A2C2C6
MQDQRWGVLPDPAQVLVIVSTSHGDRIRALNEAAPRLRPLLTTPSRVVVPGTPMLALLMVAAHQYGTDPTREDLAEVYIRTRRDYRGPDSLSALFKYRQDELRAYFDSAEPLSHDLTDQLLQGLGSVNADTAERLHRLLTQPDRRRKWTTMVPKDGIRIAVEAELAVPRLPSEVRAVLASVADQIDTAPVYYPPELKPTAITQAMSITRLDDNWLTEAHLSASGLYASMGRTGGKPAISTLAHAHRTVLLGNPGSGKSTILAALVASRIRSAPEHPTIPVRLPDLATILFHPNNSPPKNLRSAANAIVAAMARWHRHDTPKPVRIALIDAIVANPHTLLAFDAWDEVTDTAQRAAIRDTLEHLAGAPGRIVVTSRITGYDRPLPSQDEYLVDDLEPDQADDFFTAWFTHAPGVGADRVAHARRTSHEVRELIAIPLMAGLVAFVAQNDEIPTRKSALYRRYITLFLERRWRPPAEQRTDPILIARLETTAGHIAWSMATTGTDSHTLGEWQDTATITELLDSAPGSDQHLHNLIRTDGLLTLHGQPNPHTTSMDHRYRWIHRTIHEHLAARHLATMFARNPSDTLTTIREAVLDQTWNVTLEHFVGLLEPHHQDGVFRDLKAFALEGDPAEFLSGRIVQMFVHADRHSEASEVMFESAFAEHDYTLAHRIKPEATVDRILATPYSEVLWVNVADMALSMDVISEQDATLLEQTVRTLSSRLFAIDSIYKKLAVDPARVDALIVEHFESNKLGHPPILLSNIASSASSKITALLTTSRWPRTYDLARTITDFEEGTDRTELVRRLVPGNIFELCVRCAHLLLNPDSPDRSPLRTSPSLLTDDNPPDLQWYAGRFSTMSDLKNAGIWAHFGYWSSGGGIDAIDHQFIQHGFVSPPGRWSVDRAVEALAHARGLHEPPRDLAHLIEIAQAIGWLHNNPSPEALPAVVAYVPLNDDEHYTYRDSVLEVNAIELLPGPWHAIRNMTWEQFWSTARDLIPQHGWNPIQHLINLGKWEDEKSALADITNYISRSGETPQDIWFGLEGVDFDDTLRKATTARTKAARKFLLDFAVRFHRGTQLSALWPAIIHLLNTE